MSPATVFQLHLVLGYVPWLLCFGAYVWPRLKSYGPGRGALAGQLVAAYAIPIIYVPILMITHFAAFYFLARPQLKAARALAGDAAAC